MPNSVRRTSSTQSLPQRPEECRLTIEVPDRPINTSTSMTSLNLKLKRNIKRIRREFLIKKMFIEHKKLEISKLFLDNRCVGVVVLLVLGALFNGLAYMASVWSAELNAELIEAAVAKHEQSLNYKLKKGKIERKFQKSINPF